MHKGWLTLHTLRDRFPAHHARENKHPKVRAKVQIQLEHYVRQTKVMGSPELVRIILINPEALLLVWSIQTTNIVM
jgi:hypothetical protein